MKVYTITDAAKLLGLSRKTLYARIKNLSFKDCFVVNLTKKNGFLFYKKECVEKELKSKVKADELCGFTEYYYKVTDKIQNKKNITFDEAEEELKSVLKKYLKTYLKIKRFMECRVKDRNELKEFTDILRKIEAGYD